MGERWRRAFGAGIGVAMLSLAGCASMIPGANLPKPVSTALPPTTGTTLAAMFAVPPTAKPGESGYRMIGVGTDGLLARLELIDAAQRSLDLQYYIFRADRSGTAIAAALIRAADRGVRVRLLVDDGDVIPGDQRILSLAAHPSIELRIFNPFRVREPHTMLRTLEFLLHKPRLDYRMHNKLFVADNVVALIGGRNVGDQYFQVDPQSQFGDDDLLVGGPMVQQLSQVYDKFWNSELSIPATSIDRKDTTPASLARFRESSGASVAFPANSSSAQRSMAWEPLAGVRTGRTPLMWSAGQLAYDSPEKMRVTKKEVHGRLIYDAIAARSRAVSQELVMITPYFVPSPAEIDLLAGERERHAQVRALTNSLNSAPEIAAHSGYMHARPELLRLGVDLYEIRAQLGNSRGSGQNEEISRYGHYALHAKLYVFDRRSAFVGSLNFDQRSKRINTEIGLIIDNPEVSAQILHRFDELTTLDNSYHVVLRPPQNDPPGDAQKIIWETRENGAVIDYDHEPSRNAWRTLKAHVLALFPLDSEL